MSEPRVLRLKCRDTRSADNLVDYLHFVHEIDTLGSSGAFTSVPWDGDPDFAVRVGQIAVDTKAMSPEDFDEYLALFGRRPVTPNSHQDQGSQDVVDRPHRGRLR